MCELASALIPLTAASVSASSTSHSGRPRRQRRAAAAYAVARLHFEQGLSQAEIAERLSISRSTVSRLLTEARESGIVRIELRPPVSDSELGGELAASLSLRRVVVAPQEANGTRLAIVAAALEELADLALAPGDVLALGWGRALWELSGPRLPTLSGVRLVPAVGGMEETERPFQGNEIVRRAAEHSGATAHLLHAPAMPNAKLRQALARDPAIHAVVGLWDRLDAAIVGLGAPPGQPESYVPSYVANTAARQALRRSAGDIATRYFDLGGRPVPYPGEERLLALTRKQLQAADTVIGVAAGTEKVRPIVGAARARLMHVLVTDTATAAAALELAQATA
jgi:DNA-binding transcriptional regulator LsrR (DeoR family)